MKRGSGRRERGKGEAIPKYWIQNPDLVDLVRSRSTELRPAEVKGKRKYQKVRSLSGTTCLKPEISL